VSNIEGNGEGSHQQILRTTFIIGGASIINILIGLVRMKLVAVILGPAGVGLVGLLNNVMTAGSNIAALGVSNSGTRQIAEARGHGKHEAIGAARKGLFLLSVILAMAGAAAFLLSSNMIAKFILADETLADQVRWLAIGVAVTVIAGSQRALLTGFRRVGDIAKVTIISSLLSALVGTSAIYMFGDDGLLLLVLAAPITGLLTNSYFSARLPRVGKSRNSFLQIKEQWAALIRIGSAFMVAGLSVTLGQLAVRTMVQNELGVDSLGHFQAAWSISMTYIGFVLTAMGTDYYPRLTSVIADHEKSTRLVNEQAEVAILLAGPVLVAMISLAPWVIRVMYTEEFMAATSVLRWQILGDVLKILSWPMGFIILACGKGKIFMIKEALVMGFFVLLVWVLLPRLGLEATGVAFFAMYLVNIPILIYVSRMLIGFKWDSTVKKLAIQLVIVAIAIAMLSGYSDINAAIVGGGSSIVLGYLSVLRLSQLADVGGPAGKLLRKIYSGKAGKSRNE